MALEVGVDGEVEDTHLDCVGRGLVAGVEEDEGVAEDFGLSETRGEAVGGVGRKEGGFVDHGGHEVEASRGGGTGGGEGALLDGEELFEVAGPFGVGEEGFAVGGEGE